MTSQRIMRFHKETVRPLAAPAGETGGLGVPTMRKWGWQAEIGGDKVRVRLYE